MKDDAVYLGHMAERCRKILRITYGISPEAFFEDEDLQDVVIRSLEIIGEATTHISEDIKEQFSDIKWVHWKNFRNVMIHQYFRIDMHLVLGVVRNDVPQLLSCIESILDSLS